MLKTTQSSSKLKHKEQRPVLFHILKETHSQVGIRIYDLDSLQMIFSFYRKIVELEEELRVVGNNLKSLEVSEEKVSTTDNKYIYISIYIISNIHTYTICFTFSFFQIHCTFAPRPICINSTFYNRFSYTNETFSIFFRIL